MNILPKFLWTISSTPKKINKLYAMPICSCLNIGATKLIIAVYLVVPVMESKLGWGVYQTQVWTSKKFFGYPKMLRFWLMYLQHY